MAKAAFACDDFKLEEFTQLKLLCSNLEQTKKQRLENCIKDRKYELLLPLSQMFLMECFKAINSPAVVEKMLGSDLE